jgi:hypothetical protein
VSKVYVQEKKEKTCDGEELRIIEVHTSKPADFKYLVFLEK